VALRTLLHQLSDPYVQAAAEELVTGRLLRFDASPAAAGQPAPLYGAPTPEFES
jgi:hypothetical protein